MFIRYHTPDSKLCGTKNVIRSDFRLWAKNELKNEYSKHLIEVMPDDSETQVSTDDIENYTDIQIYCSKLWPRWYNAN